MSVRTTISLPDELKARMDAVEEPVNWSAEAAKCFEKLLGALAAKKQEKDMSDVIARLKASKMESEDQETTHGFEVGRQWAESQASYAELKRAARFLDGVAWGMPWDAYGPGVHAGCAILGEDPDRQVGEEFWERVGIESADMLYGDDAFVRGFLEGAESVWDAVQDQL